MTHDEKLRLAHTGDMGLAATAIRLRACRAVTGDAQNAAAAKVNVKNTVLSNAENGLTFPSRDVMRYYYREHRLDFNFIMNGDFVQLPGDVQDRLFPCLVAANIEWDQKERSSRDQAEPRTKRASRKASA